MNQVAASTKIKTKQRHRKPVHEDGVPSPHGFTTTHETLPGGRIFRDEAHDEWVALSVDQVLGRFQTREEAAIAVTKANRRRRRVTDLDNPWASDWEDETR